MAAGPTPGPAYPLGARLGRRRGGLLAPSPSPRRACGAGSTAPAGRELRCCSLWRMTARARAGRGRGRGWGWGGDGDGGKGACSEETNVGMGARLL